MFTVHNVNTNKTLSCKEHLNNDELDAWMVNAYGKFATVQVLQDLTGKVVVYTDNGDWWEVVSKGQM